jgi:hypothetical protein
MSGWNKREFNRMEGEHPKLGSAISLQAPLLSNSIELKKVIRPCKFLLQGERFILLEQGRYLLRGVSQITYLNMLHTSEPTPVREPGYCQLTDGLGNVVTQVWSDCHDCFLLVLTMDVFFVFMRGRIDMLIQYSSSPFFFIIIWLSC